MDWGIVCLTYTGAVCTHILSLYNEGFVGTKPFIEKMFPNKTDTFYFRLDFVLLPALGTCLAIVLLEPSSYKSAIFSGITWSGSLLSLMNRKNKNLEENGNG